MPPAESERIVTAVAVVATVFAFGLFSCVNPPVQAPPEWSLEQSLARIARAHRVRPLRPLRAEFRPGCLIAMRTQPAAPVVLRTPERTFGGAPPREGITDAAVGFHHTSPVAGCELLRELTGATKDAAAIHAGLVAARVESFSVAIARASKRWLPGDAVQERWSALPGDAPADALVTDVLTIDRLWLRLRDASGAMVTDVNLAELLGLPPGAVTAPEPDGLFTVSNPVAIGYSARRFERR
jgi:hypothetical protein